MTALPKSAPSTALKAMAVETMPSLCSPATKRANAVELCSRLARPAPQKKPERRLVRKRELRSQSRPEGSQHGRFYHVGALQQKRDGTGKVNETLHREIGIWGGKRADPCWDPPDKSAETSEESRGDAEPDKVGAAGRQE